MRVLITGGAGFIGSNLARTALLAGHEVVVLDDLSTGYAANLDGLDARLPRGVGQRRGRPRHGARRCRLGGPSRGPRVGAAQHPRPGGDPRRERDRHPQRPRGRPSRGRPARPDVVLVLGLRAQPSPPEERARVGPPAQPVRGEQARGGAVPPRVPAVVRVGNTGVPLLQRLRPAADAGSRLRRRGAGVPRRDAPGCAGPGPRRRAPVEGLHLRRDGVRRPPRRGRRGASRIPNR